MKLGLLKPKDYAHAENRCLGLWLQRRQFHWPKRLCAHSFRLKEFPIGPVYLKQDKKHDRKFLHNELPQVNEPILSIRALGAI